MSRAGITAATALTALALGLTAGGAWAQAPARADQLAFRDLYRELIETNTTQSEGSCTLAAQRMAARLTAARDRPRRGPHTADGPYRRGRGQARGLDP